ncbi:MAG: haloacid dehalogenase type II [Elusimicrobia bacterium]|nr:haloacid dehalogenase type II [Elusimicrobiota bacterium]
MANKIKWVTLDCYGTLIDWESGIRAVVQNLLKEKGTKKHLPSNWMEHYIQYEFLLERETYRPYREILALALSKLFEKDFSITLSPKESRTLADSLPDWSPFPDVKKVLTALKDKVKFALLSNCDDDLLKKSVRQIGVDFHMLVTAQEVGSYKPVNNHWKKFMERSLAGADEILHVAASRLHDVIPAKQLGILSVWINRKGEKDDGYTHPDFVLKDLTKLPEVLSRLI